MRFRTAAIGVAAVLVLVAGVVAVTVDDDEGSAPDPPPSLPAVAAPTLERCSDRELQVPGDPYSPPCVVGAAPQQPGELSDGVTDDEIVVTYGALFGDDAAAVGATAEALGEFFSSRYELHGRRIRLVERDEIDPDVFADIVPESSEDDAARLAEAGVIAVGALELGEAELAARRPFLWAMPWSCSVLVAAAVSHALSLDEGPVAAVVDPADGDAGCIDVPGADRLAGVIEVDGPDSAATVVTELQDLTATSVVLSLDPNVTRELVAAGVAAGFQPRWVAADRASPVDFVAQSYDQAGWSRARAVGGTATVPFTQTIAYHAFKSVRPDEEPAGTLQVIYYRLQLLAIGIQLAGPELTPSTFEAGLRAFPPAEGPFGRWDLTAGHSAFPTPAITTWDPDVVSGMNGQPGAWLPIT